MIKKKVIIIGAGPAGLSLGYHLKNLGFNDFLILEKNSYPGGLSASFKDKKGFIWDIGGHVIHNKNKEFVNFAKKVLNNQLYHHRRNALIYFKNRFIPYPFQNNIAFLPEKYKNECLEGLIKTHNSQLTTHNFSAWILNNFGSGIAKYFMIPQNKKSWQYPLNKISIEWLSKRVNLPPLEKIKKECKKNKPEVITWGSNKEFFYPKKGGIGFLWQKTADLLKNHIKFNTEVVKIDFKKKLLLFRNEKYDKIIDVRNFINYQSLISTISLIQLIKVFNSGNKIRYKTALEKVKKLALQLKYNSGLIIGLGFNKKPVNNSWHWMYFPGKNYPFFRVCLLSNFSKDMVPSPDFSSFLVEISWRKKKPNKQEMISKAVKQIGKIFFRNEKIKPVSVFSLFIPYYYPIPTLNRDKILKEINQFLKNHKIYSLGRFGAWKYEKGNMDDCFLEGGKITKDLF